MTHTIHHGDCLDVLRQMPDNSVHAIVTDPPYGLSNTTPEQVADTIVKWVSGERDYLPGGVGFMGKAWDGFVPPVAVWDEAMRVLKPGGHVLAFAGTRTMDLMTLGLRLAGFDIRESLAWLFGSGMPKSHNIGKAIDKRPGVHRHPEFAAHLIERREAAGLSRADVSERVVGTRSGACWNWEHHQFPEFKWWPALRDLLGLDDKWDSVVAEADRAVIGTNPNVERAARSLGGSINFGGGSLNADITAPATDAAKQWEGWGTATKPAFEPVVMARKPFRGTVAANVLEHGTGALNIDGCRIGLNGEKSPTGSGGPNTGASMAGGIMHGTGGNVTPPSGRWPANVILDEHMAGVLDEMTQHLSTQSAATRGGTNGTSMAFGKRTPGANYDDEGPGASRFFYVAEQGAPFMYAAKAPKKERPDVDGVKHPTVKPLSIMRWLVRLVTPPNGIVLDPFAGSGTTIEAAMLEAFDCIGIEREAEYLPLIHERIRRATEQLKTEQQQQAEAPDQGAFSLEDIA